MATVRYTIATQDTTTVNWQMHIEPHILRSCSGIILGLSFRPMTTATPYNIHKTETGVLLLTADDVGGWCGILSTQRWSSSRPSLVLFARNLLLSVNTPTIQRRRKNHSTITRYAALESSNKMW